MRKREFCKHYRAMIDHDTCKAGVAYEKFNGLPFAERPCFCTRGEKPPGGCDLAQFPTDKEMAVADAEFNRRFQNTMTARAAIVKSLGGPWKKGMMSANGELACPICKTGALRYSRAGINGHIHAQCSTADCVAWRE